MKFVFNPFTGTFDAVESVPAPTGPGQVLYSIDGTTSAFRTPLTSSDGWLVNDEGVLLVVEA